MSNQHVVCRGFVDLCLMLFFNMVSGEKKKKKLHISFIILEKAHNRVRVFNSGMESDIPNVYTKVINDLYGVVAVMTVRNVHGVTFEFLGSNWITPGIHYEPPICLPWLYR